MRFRTLAALFVLLGGSTIVLAAGNSSKDPEPKSKDDKKKEEVLTFTTADMERKFGKSAKPKPKPTAGPKPDQEKGKDPLAQLQASQEAKRDKVEQRADAGRRVRAAHEKVKELEKRMASLRNPLLGRAQPADEDREAWKGADQAARLRMTEEKLAAARSELEQALKTLNELR